MAGSGIWCEAPNYIETMWFSRKNNGERSDNSDRILQLLKEIAAEVAVYGAKVDKVEQDCRTLRGLVNRKLGNHANETESNKSNDSFDSLRALNKQFGI